MKTSPQLLWLQRARDEKAGSLAVDGEGLGCDVGIAQQFSQSPYNWALSRRMMLASSRTVNSSPREFGVSKRPPVYTDAQPKGGGIEAILESSRARVCRGNANVAKEHWDYRPGAGFQDLREKTRIDYPKVFLETQVFQYRPQCT